VRGDLNEHVMSWLVELKMRTLPRGRRAILEFYDYKGRACVSYRGHRDYWDEALKVVNHLVSTNSVQAWGQPAGIFER
jgi:hypothetical protein